MKIGFVGLGKLGLPVALAVESKGHEVFGFDIKQEIYDHRKNRFLKIGRDKGFVATSNLSDGKFSDKDSMLSKIKTSLTGKYLQLSLVGLIIITLAIVFTVIK